ncbi:response regulator [Caulobacter flavus]|uniref:Response regulator n=1 Tax=Caulobacter flavus TaxID=1679497 RepID=A0A2N5CX01_9CAUL|nr:response regulator [Caulobacter flavus]AYV47501.1 response regulator [Caulobacter flavus]PLR18342.1 response regulator [Caulobacter flavus]
MVDDGHSPPQARPLILVVEDEPLVRALACDILEDGGFRSLEAGSAREAIAIIAARTNIAILFTDVDMPGEINGVGLAYLVSKQAPEVKIVVTSGAGARTADDLPANARFLLKPYSPATLIDLIGGLLAAER